MTDDDFNQAIHAVRAAGDDEAPRLASATRNKLRRSLDDHARHRRKLGIITIIVGMFGGTMAWAVTSGKFPVFARPSEREVVEQPDRDPHVPMKLPIAAHAVADPHREALPPVVVAPPPAALPPTPPPPPVVPAVKRPKVDLYRKAHELHFRGTDHAAALVAWDAYLASEPTGPFVVDAKFNRAVLLVRLHRYDDALAALAPFVRGEVSPAGYRREEARRLVDRLERVNDR